MHRNIHRGNPHFYNALHLAARHIGHGDIVPVQKRQPCVVVLKVQRVPQPFGQLVYKTENTMVTAMLGFFNQRVFKFYPQILIILFFYHYLAAALYVQPDFFVRAQKAVFQDIMEILSVD